ENYRHIGNLQVDFGEPDKGIEMLRQGLNIAEDVYSRQTGELDDIVHLANAYEAVGNAELRLRNVAAALQNYRSMQQVWERSVADFPKDRASHGQAICYFLVGAALAERGDLMAALQNFRRALAIREALVKEHPTNTKYRRGLEEIYNRMGSLSGNPMFINLGDKAAALEYSRRALTLSEELAASDQKNSQAQSDLALNCGN